MTPSPRLPSLAMLLSRQQLAHAWLHVARRGTTAGIDRLSTDAFAQGAAARLDRLHLALQQGTYRPSPLRTIPLAKPRGGIRQLAIPTVADRIAQRAVLSGLGPPLDALFHPHTYAYRPGHSYRQAVQAVHQAIVDGCSVMLDADIEAFFDHIQYAPLQAQLTALGIAPAIIRLLMGWVQAPLADQPSHTRRLGGIPQGTVVGPWLTNVYLNQVDHALTAAGLRHVRYADDIIVACHSRAQAQQALHHLTALLAQLGLALHPSKTQITPLHHGFVYLGHRFAPGHPPRPARETAPTLRPAVTHRTAPQGSPSLPIAPSASAAPRPPALETHQSIQAPVAEATPWLPSIHSAGSYPTGHSS